MRVPLETTLLWLAIYLPHAPLIRLLPYGSFSHLVGLPLNHAATPKTAERKTASLHVSIRVIYEAAEN